METSKTYNRTINLLDKYTKFIKSIDTEDIGNNLTLDKLIELKSILSDINNIMTLISTRCIATKLSDILSFKNEDRERIFNDIDKQKPNTNGFDIRIDSPVKILVEVKCNSLIRNKKFGAAQINAILEDARKLRLESSRHIKASKSIQDTKDYIKIEYGDGGKLYFPVTQLHMIQKYADSESKQPKLNKLNGQEWTKTKSRVQKAVNNIAKELVERMGGSIEARLEGKRFVVEILFECE